jgi:hypothetical protein
MNVNRFLLTTKTRPSENQLGPFIESDGGLLIPERPLFASRPLSRRDFMKATGIGATSLVLGLGVPSRRAEAVPFLVDVFVRFVATVIAGLSVAYLTRTLRTSQWQEQRPTSANADERFHNDHVEPYETNAVIEPVESEHYRNYYFELRRRNRYGHARRLEQFTDLNREEATAFTDLAPANGGRYCLVADPRNTRRRRLSPRDRELSVATWRRYTVNDRSAPAESQIIWAESYAREVSDSQGNQFTGFSFELRQPRHRYFLIATASSL